MNDSLNASKYNTMSFNRRDLVARYKFTIGKALPNHPELVKDLGMDFDCKLSLLLFKFYVDVTVSSAFR